MIESDAGATATVVAEEEEEATTSTATTGRKSHTDGEGGGGSTGSNDNTDTTTSTLTTRNAGVDGRTSILDSVNSSINNISSSSSSASDNVKSTDRTTTTSSIHRLSSSSIYLDDCPICLDVMTKVDQDHPLQCEIHCGFNMCRSCIESLIESSKDGYQEASDGSHQLKIWLHCPNCRSDLTGSIRDTLLLRKADEIQHLLRKQGSNNSKICIDGIHQRNWTSSQIRLYKALDTPEVQTAISYARKFEDQYLGRLHEEEEEEEEDGEEEEDRSYVFGGSVTENYEEGDEFTERSEASESWLGGTETGDPSISVEEWGVEADLDVGVHASFRMPEPPLPPQPVVREEAIKVDPTLFAGLDYFLDDEQRLEITKLMTSGQSTNLSKAAIILYDVVNQKINHNTRSSPPHSQPSQPPPQVPPRQPFAGSGESSSRQLSQKSINDSDRTSTSTTTSNANTSNSSISRPPLGRRTSSISRPKFNRRKSLARRSSVFDLIEESNEAHLKHQQRRALAGVAAVASHDNDNAEEKKVAEETTQLYAIINSGGGGKGSTPTPGRVVAGGDRSRIAQHRVMEREIQLQAEFQKRFPLPVRMPKAIEINLELPIDLEFVDYTWGGTVLDAYSKITIGFRQHVFQRRPNNVQVRMILGQDSDGFTSIASSTALGCAFGLCASSDEDDYNDHYIAIPGEARVLLSHAGRSGRSGAMRGDVVTHLDGECLAGMSASTVLEMLRYKQQQLCDTGDTTKTVMITLNAERSVAEALKRRAMAISEM
mmetsp:Transcript_13350/g.32646  ORF Transcript_13350/g.32646 Transcript_13350/m.32646 type:complete len:769 (+) Transcript_13350:90-2396(+)